MTIGSYNEQTSIREWRSLLLFLLDWRIIFFRIELIRLNGKIKFSLIVILIEQFGIVRVRPGAENVFMIIMNDVTLGKGINFMHFIVEYLLTNSTNLPFIIFLAVFELIKLVGGALPFPDTRNIFKLL